MSAYVKKSGVCLIAEADRPSEIHLLCTRAGGLAMTVSVMVSVCVLVCVTPTSA